MNLTQASRQHLSHLGQSGLVAFHYEVYALRCCELLVGMAEILAAEMQPICSALFLDFSDGIAPLTDDPGNDAIWICADSAIVRSSRSLRRQNTLGLGPDAEVGLHATPGCRVIFKFDVP